MEVQFSPQTSSQNKNVGNTAILDIPVETKQKIYFSVKNPSPLKSMLLAKFQTFDNKNQSDVNHVKRKSYKKIPKEETVSITRDLF